MDDDILAEFRPLEETRKKILTHPDRLNRVTDVWERCTLDILHRVGVYYKSFRASKILTEPLPDGYRELVELLVFWCDASQFSIDATPLDDFIIAWEQYKSRSMQAPAGHLCDSRDSDEFYEAVGRANNVIKRMRLAAANLELTRSKGHGGRPKDPEVAARRKKVRALHEKGLTLGQIAAELDVATYIVKQDIQRSKQSAQTSFEKKSNAAKS